MNGSPKRSSPIRFSVFELDLDSGELFKQGRKVKLQGQPFELLLALVDRAGEVVTREELKRRVWPSDTVVDFDHGLNRAIGRYAWGIASPEGRHLAIRESGTARNAWMIENF